MSENKPKSHSAETLDKIRTAREAYQTNHGPESRRASAAACRAARKGRTAEQQLALLDERLGAGIGAKKERARLALLMISEDSPLTTEAPASNGKGRRSRQRPQLVAA